MKLGILLSLLFLMVLILPAQPGKHKHGHGDEHGHGHRHRHDKQASKQLAKHAKKYSKFVDIIQDLFFQGRRDDDEGDDEDDDHSSSEWIYDLQEPDGQCNPNPCRNGGVCEEKGKGKRFKCDCPKPFKGKKCEKASKVCKKRSCGRGECVLTSASPFYECKCKEPFQPPNCMLASACYPNPCKNNGTCVIDGHDFDCLCDAEFKGRFCQVGSDDCYEDNGESYRGHVSETEDGDECLHWNSHFIVDQGVDPFTGGETSEGLGHHNFCRNPDSDILPWCFIRKGRSLRWDYCDIDQCLEPTDVPPTGAVPPGPKPTDPQPTGSKPVPTEAKPTQAKPTKPEPTQPDPTKPEPTSPPEVPTWAPSAEPAPTPPVPVQPTLNTSVEPEQFSTCGKAQPKKSYQRIFGGLKVSPGALPWQVSLQVRTKGSSQIYRHTCGGVLISSCWVLTAGHCIDKKNEMQAVMGELSLGLDDSTEQTLHVDQVIVHENYTLNPYDSVSSDIALLRLRGENGACAEETQFVKTICLPEGPLPDGSECTISGWGATENSQYGSDHLLDAKVLLINQNKCSTKEVYGAALDETMFCAGYLKGGVDSCQGDSGGPLFCEKNRTQFVYGLVSWGDECGRKNKPGVYSRITNFLDWIKSKTETVSAK
ncbi:hypothetical protein CRUP_021202 [Coryphaenoides rupestris]|nr:hypothetical protein CRUP_021202 [Coryphaenoides rupestris]